ncbi:MAG: hypothetical protein KDE19_05375 [Caldilineaceae bacterium]|nr:hypothetical protein [Caldilineaceae bacterium]
MRITAQQDLMWLTRFGFDALSLPGAPRARRYFPSEIPKSQNYLDGLDTL